MSKLTQTIRVTARNGNKAFLIVRTRRLTKAKAKKIIKAYAKRHKVKLAYDGDLPDIEQGKLDMFMHRNKMGWTVTQWISE